MTETTDTQDAEALAAALAKIKRHTELTAFAEASGIDSKLAPQVAAYAIQTEKQTGADARRYINLMAEWSPIGRPQAFSLTTERRPRWWQTAARRVAFAARAMLRR